MNKTHKIINDPVYGFISIDDAILMEVVELPYMQRLRRIHQLGMSSLVYPGATHSRLQHSLGAMHLMQLAVKTLIEKECDITQEEALALKLAILMHDIGHGPFSHVLEYNICSDVSHEDLTLLFMKRINERLGGKLSLAIDIFSDSYPKHFLHQLISSSLDVDRLDYIKRDSFYTGVAEGAIGVDRLLMMLDVSDNQLVVESKGVYSVEKMIIARRLMYWQVYLHKTVVKAEKMLNQIFRRARELTHRGEHLAATPALSYFLNNDVTLDDFKSDPTLLDRFAMLDDNDVLSAIKCWMSSSDRTLAILSDNFINRRLPGIEIRRDRISDAEILECRKRVQKEMKLTEEESTYFVMSGKLSSRTYARGRDKINIMYSNGVVRDIAEVSDVFELQNISDKDNRYYLCCPKL